MEIQIQKYMKNQKSHLHICEKEACPHNLAPTASTTTALVAGDVIAIILMKMKNFEARNFGENHPEVNSAKLSIFVLTI